MKIIFEFDGNEPQEEDQAMVMMKATDARIALWDIEQLFRNAIKYEGFMGPEYLTEEEEAVVNKLKGRFYEILEEHDLTKHILEMP